MTEGLQVCNSSKEDAGLHMAWFCDAAGVISWPRAALISSYFARRMLIIMPLLHWYLLNGLVVTRLYLPMQYDRRSCSQSLQDLLHVLLLTSLYMGNVVRTRHVPSRLFCECFGSQQGHGLQPLRGHETFAGRSSAQGGPLIACVPVPTWT